MRVIIETERLIIRNLRPGDEHAVFVMNMRYLLGQVIRMLQNI